MSDETTKKSLKSVVAELNKRYGENSVMDLSSVEVPKVERVSTGLSSLDLVLGGGIPLGRLMEIHGPESSGKSTLSLHIMRRFQEAFPDKRVALIDVENAYDPDYSEALGLKNDEMYLSQPNRAEDALSIVEKLCLTGEISLIVVDSVAQLVPTANLAKDIDETANIGTLARLLSQTLPRLVDASAKYGTAIIFINQIRMQIGVMYGNPETVPGGLALKFASSIRLETRGSKAEDRNGVDGMAVRIKVVKNKLAKPGMKTEIFLAFGRGFDEVIDVVNTAVELNVVNQKGAWYEYKEIKAQGLESLTAQFRESPAMLDDLRLSLSAINV